MNEIASGLYQFTIYIPPKDFTIHQYLLASDPAILFATGTWQQAKQILPDIQRILDGEPLKYIFVSNMESDEAGGLAVFQQAYPNVTVICGALAARELPGYGYEGALMVKKGGDILEDGELNLKFTDYPAEVHMQNGLLCFEANHRIFYSSDLMQRFGNGIGKSEPCKWLGAVEAISYERLGGQPQTDALKAALRTISPTFIAVGHGFCLTCEEE